MAKLSGHLERPASTNMMEDGHSMPLLRKLEFNQCQSCPGGSKQSKLMSLAIVQAREEILQFTACTKAGAHLLRSAKVDDPFGKD